MREQGFMTKNFFTREQFDARELKVSNFMTEQVSMREQGSMMELVMSEQGSLKK